MPVIGSLDRQVEEVIINPLAKRTARDEESDANSAANVASREKEEMREEEGLPRAQADKAQALPIWLL